MKANHPLSGLIQDAESLENWKITGRKWIKSPTDEILTRMLEGPARETARFLLRTTISDRFGL